MPGFTKPSPTQNVALVQLMASTESTPETVAACHSLAPPVGFVVSATCGGPELPSALPHATHSDAEVQRTPPTRIPKLIDAHVAPVP